MINEHLDRTLATLVSDADFLSAFPEKLRSFNEQEKTLEDKNAMIKRAAALILHIIDYCVTSSVIDMDADISRYCHRYSAEAKKLRDRINMAGLSLKENYQYLFEDGTVYTENIAMFSFMYSLFLGISRYTAWRGRQPDNPASIRFSVHGYFGTRVHFRS